MIAQLAALTASLPSSIVRAARRVVDVATAEFQPHRHGPSRVLSLRRRGRHVPALLPPGASDPRAYYCTRDGRKPALEAAGQAPHPMSGGRGPQGPLGALDLPDASTNPTNTIRDHMPLIIIQANVSGQENPHVTFSERAAAANLESLHYRTQLIERLSWATADAEALESDVAAGAGNSPIASRRSARDRPPTRRAGHARHLLTALALVIVAALSLTPVALARPGRGQTSSHHEPADHETTEIGLPWCDITDQTSSRPETGTNHRPPGDTS